jgi:hypothetical protein
LFAAWALPCLSSHPQLYALTGWIISCVILWAKLHASQDPVLARQLRRIHPQTCFIKDPQRADFWVDAKLRTVDPPVLVAGQIQPLSQLDREFAQKRQDYLTSQSGKQPFYVEAF